VLFLINEFLLASGRAPISVEVYHELLNGIWTMLGLMLLVAYFFRLAWRLHGTWVQLPGQDRLWTRVCMLYNKVSEDLGIQVLIPMTIYFLGSIGRSAWLWSILNCIATGGECAHIREGVGLLEIAAVLGVIGALCFVRVFLPKRIRLFGLDISRTWVWGGAGLISVAVPFAVVLWGLRIVPYAGGG
jgi:hypothetical protein